MLCGAAGDHAGGAAGLDCRSTTIRPAIAVMRAAVPVIIPGTVCHHVFGDSSAILQLPATHQEAYVRVARSPTLLECPPAYAYLAKIYDGEPRCTRW
jgi:hypothetical protein